MIIYLFNLNHMSFLIYDVNIKLIYIVVTYSFNHMHFLVYAVSTKLIWWLFIRLIKWFFLFFVVNTKRIIIIYSLNHTRFLIYAVNAKLDMMIIYGYHRTE